MDFGEGESRRHRRVGFGRQLACPEVGLIMAVVVAPSGLVEGRRRRMQGGRVAIGVDGATRVAGIGRSRGGNSCSSSAYSWSMSRRSFARALISLMVSNSSSPLGLGRLDSLAFLGGWVGEPLGVPYWMGTAMVLVSGVMVMVLRTSGVAEMTRWFLSW